MKKRNEGTNYTSSSASGNLVSKFSYTLELENLDVIYSSVS